jgi:hypothetical protein
MNQSAESSTQVDESSVSKMSTAEQITRQAEWKISSIVPNSVKITREGTRINMVDGETSIGSIHVIESTQWQNDGKFKIMWDRWDNGRRYDGTQIGRAKIEYGSPAIKWIQIKEFAETIKYVWNMEITKAISEPSIVRGSIEHTKVQKDWVNTIPRHQSIVGGKVHNATARWGAEKVEVSIITPKDEASRQAMMKGTKSICPPTKAIMKIVIESDVEVTVGGHRIDTTSYSHTSVPVITIVGSTEEVDKVIKKIAGNPLDW